ncbi:MAG: acyltransferase [Planctomycetes bacterium]|nr:acyltransferase [Planctomycetota bacterium]
MIDAGADTDKQWQSSQGLSEQTFTEHTLLANASDDCHDNAKRAQILGFTAAEVKIAPGAIVRIGENQIGENSFVGLYSYVNGDVHIGKNVLIGPHCSLPAGNHMFSPTTQSFSDRDNHLKDCSIHIGDGTWLASGVTITGGVKIGKANLIFAGAVVTRDTADYALIAGTPAKQIGHIMPETGEYIYE